MSKFEELVPPLDLCKQIPAGEFEDSAFIFVKFKYTEENAPRILPREHEITKLFADDFEIYPAPTLNESEVWHVNASLHFCKASRKFKSPSVDALKMWLVWKGI